MDGGSGRRRRRRWRPFNRVAGRSRAQSKYALAEFPEAAITALHVVRLPEGYWAAFVDSESELPGCDVAPGCAQVLLETGVQTAAECDPEIVEYDHAIVEYAIGNGFDQIVGSYGRKRADRVLYGSVSERIVRYAPMTVVVHES